MKFTAKVKFTTPEQSSALVPSTPAQTTPPTLPRKVIHYTHAVATHLLTGSQTRTDEEVTALLTICHSCDHLDHGSGSCNLCGCRCNRQKSPFVNKLRIKSQKCPEEKWQNDFKAFIALFFKKERINIP